MGFISTVCITMSFSLLPMVAMCSSVSLKISILVFSKLVMWMWYQFRGLVETIFIVTIYHICTTSLILCYLGSAFKSCLLLYICDFICCCFFSIFRLKQRWIEVTVDRQVKELTRTVNQSLKRFMLVHKNHNGVVSKRSRGFLLSQRMFLPIGEYITQNLRCHSPYEFIVLVIRTHQPY
jgi:hypothetical protein